MKSFEKYSIIIICILISCRLTAGENAISSPETRIVSDTDYIYTETGKYGSFKFLGATMGLALYGSPEASFIPSFRFMYYPKNSLGFIVEVDYKSATYEPAGVFVNEKAHYLDLTAMISYKIKSFFVGAGSFISILLSSSLEPVAPADQAFIKSLNMEYNRLLIGALISFGFITNDKLKFLISFDIGIGFNGIGNNVSDNASHFFLILKFGVGF